MLVAMKIWPIYEEKLETSETYVKCRQNVVLKWMDSVVEIMGAFSLLLICIQFYWIFFDDDLC